MDHDYAQRRRVALAIAVTAIAGPAAFLLNRSDDSSTADPTPVATVTTLVGQVMAQPAADPTAAETDPLGTAPVGYLSGSTLPDNTDPAQIAVPRLPDSVKGAASFSNAITDTTRCQAKLSTGIPFNAILQVTNLDNSRSVQCVASVGGADPATEIVLASDTFAQIADLTDAPVPVQVTWTTG